MIFWGSNTEVLRTYQVRPTIAWLLRGFTHLIRHVVKGVVTSGYSRRKREYLNEPGTTAKTPKYGLFYRRKYDTFTVAVCVGIATSF